MISGIIGGNILANGAASLVILVQQLMPLKYVAKTTDWMIYICDIPWHKAFPRNTFIINVNMYFGATEKWHVWMVMVSRVVQLAGASDAPPGTRVSNRPVYAVISVMPDV